MTDERLTRRRILASLGTAGTAGLAGCNIGDPTETRTETDESTTEESTAESGSTATAATDTSTATAEPEPDIEITEVTVKTESVTVGNPVEIEVLLRNSGDVEGVADLTLNLDGEAVREEQVEIPADEQRRTVITSPDTRETGTVTAAINDRTAGDVTIESPEFIHVSTDGDDDNPGTEDEPLATIQAAVDEAGPGQTVDVHPGEYFEFIEFREDGEPDAPITLTGPPDAVLKPPRDVDWGCIGVGANHVHITGLTISGLYNPDEPENPDSYTPMHLVSLNNWAEDSDDYLEGLVVSPHRIGNAGGALINSVMLKDCEIGGFEVIGPAGAAWLFDDEEEGHYGEFVYLGTAGDNRTERGYDDYDRTRNIYVHHIDNSAGHPHSELVDIKEGVSNVTVEYCTDAGGVQSEDSYSSQSINLGGHDCTIRWNVIQNAMGSGVEIGPWGFMHSPEEFLAKPETEFDRKLGKNNAIYGNVFTGNKTDAIDFLRESWRPGQEGNPTPEDQRALCDNLYDGYSDADPSTSCSADLPSSDGVGHLGGESPWDGDAATQEEVFEEDAVDPHLETTVEANDVSTNTDLEATVTITNDSDSSEEVELRFRVREHVLETRHVSVAAGETREVTLHAGGIPNPDEVWIMRNGQKIGRLHVLQDQ